MRVLLANLKFFYRCRRLWPTYAVWGPFVLFAVGTAQLHHAVFIVLVALAFPAGSGVAAVQMELVPKPFTFCLPGHRDNIRRLIFLVGSGISVVGGLYFALVHGVSDGSPVRFVLTACLGLCFTGALYLIATACAWGFGSALVGPGVLPVVGTVLLAEYGLNVDDILLRYPLRVILLGLFITIAVWQRLSHPAWFRNRCAKPVLTSLSLPSFFGNPSFAEELRQIDASVNVPQPHPAVDRYLLDRIRGCRPSEPAKYLWGMVYTTLLPLALLLIAKWRKVVLGMFLWFVPVLAVGYMPPLASAFFFFALLTILAIGSTAGSPLFSHTLISAGRRERFYVTMISMSIFAPLSAIVLISLVLGLNALGSLFPEVPLGSLVLTFRRFPVWYPLLSMIILPVWGLIGFWILARQFGAMVLGIVGPITMVLLILWAVSMASVTVILLIAVLAWSVFGFGAHRVAMHSDLGRK
jgi:hypothetical protein